MSRNSEVFAATLAIAALQANGDEVQATVLQDMLDHIDESGELSTQLDAALRKSPPQPGDFGMEILGPILASLLIEAGKRLWETYSKKLIDEAGGQLATLTVSKVQSLAGHLWKNETRAEASAAFEQGVKELAAEHGIAAEQIAGLLEAVRSQGMQDVLADKA